MCFSFPLMTKRNFMEVKTYFHRPSGTLSYLIIQGSDAVIIDPVLDYCDGTIGYKPVDVIIIELKKRKLSLMYILGIYSAYHYKMNKNTALKPLFLAIV